MKPRHPTQPAAKKSRLVAQIQEIYTLYKQSQLTKAQQQITRLLAKNKHSPDAHTLAAMIAVSTGDKERAEYHAQSAVKLDPKNTDALTTLGSIHALNADHKQAQLFYKQALQINPHHPPALSGLGTSQSELGQYQTARKTLKAAQAISPNLPEPLVNRALLELDTTHAARAISILRSAPPALAKHPAVLDLQALAHSYDDTKTPEQIFQAHKDYGDELESQIPPQRHSAHHKDPNRTLRIGYLSGNLYQHSNSYFLEPLLAHANTDQFQTHLFSTSARKDEVTDRLIEHADHWHQCNNMPLPILVEHIRSKEIDILVELAGHFAGHRLPVFAAKPAPVQITFIGYANTTGLSRIDYRFVDNITDPTEQNHLATECLHRLPGCFLCYQPPSQLPEIKEPDQARAFTIGSFNNLKKLSDSTIKAWSSILTQRPEIRLLIKSSKLANQELRSELQNRFEAQGIHPDRLDLRAFSPTTNAHLDTYNDLDLAMDTFPYTGTTTTCESLIMGVPVLTLMGTAHAGRVSASLLTAIDRADMIADTEEDYITKSLAIIDKGILNKTDRETLQNQTKNSTLCNQSPYTAKVENEYRTLWTQWCASK